MTCCKFNSKITNRLRSLSRIDINLARFVAAAAVVLQVWDHGSRIYRYQKFLAEGGEILIDSSFYLMHLKIALALLISAICLWFRKATAFYLSMMALAWVIYEYLGWYFRSITTLENAGLERWPDEYPHAFNIGGATGWNIAILLLVSVLFVWHLKTLFGIFSSDHVGSKL